MLCDPTREREFPRHLLPEDSFYRAIHPTFIKKGGRISPSAFQNPGRPISDRMSVDWSEKSSPQETYDRWKDMWGDRHGVASIIAQLCWDNEQSLEYTPNEDNPAHSDVVGPKEGDHVRVRKRLADGAKLVVGPEGVSQ